MSNLALFTMAGSLSLLTLAAAILSDGSLALTLVPTLIVGALYAIWKLPLRYPVLALVLLALTLENPSDVPAVGLWKSPLYPVGALLLAHMNLTFTSQRWMLFSGLDLVLVYLFAVALVRRASGSRVDSEGDAESARPMRLFAALSLLGALWMWVHGMTRSGVDVGSSLWQVQRVVYLPAVFLLIQLSLRAPEDRLALGRVIVAAACVKSVVALGVRAMVPPPAGQDTLQYATTHPDSMLFACAFVMVLARLIEGARGRRTVSLILVLSLLAAGMVANHRRVVWVELGAALALFYLMIPASRGKRTIARGALLVAPLTLLYIAAGWGSSSAAFGPVQTIRSVVDSDADPSTMWRDWENYNLFYTLRQSPLLGTGYGHGYIEVVRLPDISQAYPLYRFSPHNSILALWAHGGLVGFVAQTTMLAVGLYFAVRAARHAERPVDRTAALSTGAAIVVYLIHCYGDMGLGTWTSVFMVGPALAVASQVAVVTGAWPARRRAFDRSKADSDRAPAPWAELARRLERGPPSRTLVR